MPPKFVPRERKHRRLAKVKTATSRDDTELPNTEEILPISKSEREDKRQSLKDEILAQQPESKISSQKRKRLDKYINTKLRKEENLELLKKLAAHKVDTSLLQSASRLGQVTETKRDRIRRALNERQAGVDVNGDQDEILFERRPVADDVPEIAVAPVASGQAQVTPAVSKYGSGLKRPLETDDTGRPVIKKRKRRGNSSNKPSKRAILEIEHDDESEDEGSLDQDDGTSSTSSEWEGFSDGDNGNPENQSDDLTSSQNSDDEDEESSASSISEEGERESKPVRVSAFKAWADTQRNDALGFTPSTVPTNDPAIRANFRPRKPSPDPDTVTDSSVKVSASAYRASASVTVSRPDVIQAARLELPVVRDEQKIIEAIHNNPVVVVCGSTGSGKTTQVPQMLLENGYATTGMIGITQPRRVAATSVATRVAYELGDDFGRRVAHQVRYDSNVSRNTSIKFMTDGILLRELSQDFVLSKYSVIVIDEAHERSINTDILIGMLSRIVPLRETLSKEQPGKYHPLKLIIMSATLRVTDFVLNDRLFKQERPTIVEAEGRQYAVTDHFSRRTQRDYVEETVQKVSRAHRKLPPGGILVFLTGQDEIESVMKRLRAAFASETNGFQTFGRFQQTRKRDYVDDDPADESDSEVDITGVDDSDDEDGDDFVVEQDPSLAKAQGRSALKAHIIPLYAALPSHQQKQVFDPPPDGHRMIVLATNVAETSLTIPGIRYVFDCGRSKEKCYDPATGVQEFKIDWISKASAAQRKGRAGRTGPGHCYKLYSSAIYERYFAEHTDPELLRTPIEGTVLQLKNLEVDNVINFPFPTPPDRAQLAKAESLLKNLGAIDAKVGKITDLGKELIHYPVNPRYGKMLLLGLRNGVAVHTIALVAGLAVGELFISQPRVLASAAAAAGGESEEEYEARVEHTAAASDAAKRRQAHGRAHAKLSQWDDRSDAIKILTAIAAHATASHDNGSFCAEYFLRGKGMSEAQQLRRQLHNITQSRATGDDVSFFKAEISIPKPKEIALLQQVVAAGFIDQVAIRADLLKTTVVGLKARRATEVAYRTLVPSNTDIDRTASPEEQEEQKNSYVHPSSVLARLSVTEMPAYIVYSELSRSTASVVGAAQKRVRLHPLTTVGPKQLAALAEGTPLLSIGKPMGKIEDRDAGKRRECWVPVSLKAPGGSSSEWPLGAWKVVQIRVQGKDWVVEKVLSRGAA